MNEEMKLKILYQWLDDMPFEGITFTSLQNSAVKAGYASDLVDALFPHKLHQALKELSFDFDARMIRELEHVNIESLPVRERVKTATMARLRIMDEHKESYKVIMAYWANPMRVIPSKKMLWNTADRIWTWAGDTATDYNRHTKRGLLSSVLCLTYFYWQQDKSLSLEKTEGFLHRSLDNTVQIGRMAGTIVQKLKSIRV
jgi:ubiquinone biosynthesis protein COQ9